MHARVTGLGRTPPAAHPAYLPLGAARSALLFCLEMLAAKRIALSTLLLTQTLLVPFVAKF